MPRSGAKRVARCETSGSCTDKARRVGDARDVFAHLAMRLFLLFIAQTFHVWLPSLCGFAAANESGQWAEEESTDYADYTDKENRKQVSGVRGRRSEAQPQRD